MKLIKRADTKIAKNCVKWVREHEKFPDLSMVIFSPPDYDFSSDVCFVFGKIRENFGKGNQECVLFYDVEYPDEPIWSCATNEEYLDAIAEWDYDDEALVHIQRAIVAATGLSDKEFCQEFKIKPNVFNSWLKENPVAIPLAKIKKIWKFLRELV